MPSFDLSGRVALVTGSNRGIGRAIALTFAEYGADVIIHCAHNIAQAEEVAEAARAYGVRAAALAADLSETDAPSRIAAFVEEQFGQLDILVLNASLQIRKGWAEITRDEYTTQMTVNFRASVELIQAIAPGMMARGWGRILTIGSVQQVKPHPEMLIYAASKMAQVSIMKNLARQFAPHGVTVNNLAPGVIETDRNAQALSNTAYRQQVINNIPVGYTGEIEDCAGAALLLCSDAGRYINGVDLLVDGGMHLA